MTGSRPACAPTYIDYMQIYDVTGGSLQLIFLGWHRRHRTSTGNISPVQLSLDSACEKRNRTHTRQPSVIFGPHRNTQFSAHSKSRASRVEPVRSERHRFFVFFSDLEFCAPFGRRGNSKRPGKMRPVSTDLQTCRSTFIVWIEKLRRGVEVSNGAPGMTPAA